MKTAQIKLLGAMALWGTMSLFVKNIEMASSMLALTRAVIAVITLYILRCCLHQKIDWHACRQDWAGLLISGAALGLNWTMLFSAYNYVSVSVATLCYYFAPTLIILFCAIFFHEKMTQKQWLCFLISTVGLILIINVNSSGNDTNMLKGIFFGLSAAIFYAVIMLANKTIHHVGGIDRTLIQLMISILFLFPYCFMTSSLALTSLSLHNIINILILGIVYTAFAYTLFFSAISELPGQKAAIMTYIDPLVAVLTSALILHETILPMQILGGILVIGSAIISEIK